MGGTGTAFEHNAWATSWNPANLFHMRGHELAIDVVEGNGSRRQEHAAFIYQKAGVSGGAQ